ncbi:MAG: ribosomal protein S18-alanine N-acetyltransferase [Desulfuromonadales bacterium]|nr:ribosomal protein S18-alanine N-acetyltransferase [Desulfuromonadales bacterium]
MQNNHTIIFPEGDSIEPMQLADLIAVHQLECASQQEPWSLQHFADELDNPVATVILYWHCGQLAGFLCSWLIAGELQIQNLATLPALRRRGVAARLLEHAIARSRVAGLTSVWLEVRASNAPAIALYKRFGFSACGKRCAYYPDGEDALIMTFDAVRSEE